MSTDVLIMGGISFGKTTKLNELVDEHNKKLFCIDEIGTLDEKKAKQAWAKIVIRHRQRSQ